VSRIDLTRVDGTVAGRRLCRQVRHRGIGHDGAACEKRTDDRLALGDTERAQARAERLHDGQAREREYDEHDDDFDQLALACPGLEE
jgi:hypothetical protein